MRAVAGVSLDGSVCFSFATPSNCSKEATPLKERGRGEWRDGEGGRRGSQSRVDLELMHGATKGKTNRQGGHEWKRGSRVEEGVMSRRGGYEWKRGVPGCVVAGCVPGTVVEDGC